MAGFRHLKLIEISTLESLSNLFEVFQCPSIFFRRFLFCGAPVVPLELANGSTSQRGDFGNHVDSYWQTTRFTGALAKQGMFKGQEMFGCRSCSHVVVFLTKTGEIVMYPQGF